MQFTIQIVLKLSLLSTTPIILLLFNHFKSLSFPSSMFIRAQILVVFCPIHSRWSPKSQLQIFIQILLKYLTLISQSYGEVSQFKYKNKQNHHLFLQITVNRNTTYLGTQAKHQKVILYSHLFHIQAVTKPLSLKVSSLYLSSFFQFWPLPLPIRINEL